MESGPESTAKSTEERIEEVKPYFWQGKIGPAFWTVAGIFSVALNVILIVILILLGRELFGLKDLVSEQLVGGLYENFILMDEAVISTTVPVVDTIPVQFTLPVKTNTTVVLTEDTLVENASVNLTTGGLTITNAPSNIVLRAGTELPVKLDIQVPVDTTVPVELEVNVAIPLKDTQLHDPFVGLQNVLGPYVVLLADAPDSWGQVFCPTGTQRLCFLFDRDDRAPKP